MGFCGFRVVQGLESKVFGVKGLGLWVWLISRFQGLSYVHEGRRGDFDVWRFRAFGRVLGRLPAFIHVVRQAKTECGIHTRTTFAGAPHGGSLVDLMVKDENLG